MVHGNDAALVQCDLQTVLVRLYCPPDAGGRGRVVRKQTAYACGSLYIDMVLRARVMVAHVCQRIWGDDRLPRDDVRLSLIHI